MIFTNTILVKNENDTKESWTFNSSVKRMLEMEIKTVWTDSIHKTSAWIKDNMKFVKKMDTIIMLIVKINKFIVILSLDNETYRVFGSNEIWFIDWLRWVRLFFWDMLPSWNFMWPSYSRGEMRFAVWFSFQAYLPSAKFVLLRLPWNCVACSAIRLVQLMILRRWFILWLKVININLRNLS